MSLDESAQQGPPFSLNAAFSNTTLPPPTGLVNLTNTCFMNSSIQLVWRALIDELLCEATLEHGNVNGGEGEEGEEAYADDGTDYCAPATSFLQSEFAAASGGDAKTSSAGELFDGGDEDDDDFTSRYGKRGGGPKGVLKSGGGKTNKKSSDGSGKSVSFATSTVGGTAPAALSKKQLRDAKKAEKNAFDAASAKVNSKERDEEADGVDRPITVGGSSGGGGEGSASSSSKRTLLGELKARIAHHLAEASSQHSDSADDDAASSSAATSGTTAFNLLSKLFLSMHEEDISTNNASSSSGYNSKAKARAARSILTQLKEKLSTQNERFMDWDQHDAHELAQSLIAVLHSELNRGVGMSSSNYKQIDDVKRNETEDEAAHRWLKHMLSRDNSLITDMFHFTTKTVTTCGHCSKKSYNFDSVGELQLNLMDTSDAKRIEEAAAEKRATMQRRIDESLLSTGFDNNAMMPSRNGKKAAAGEAADKSTKKASDYDQPDSKAEEDDEKEATASDNSESDAAEDENKNMNEKVSPNAAAATAVSGGGAAPAIKKLSAKQIKAQEKAAAKAQKEAEKAEKRAKRNGKNVKVADADEKKASNKKKGHGNTVQQASSSASSAGNKGRHASSYAYTSGSCVSLQALIENHLDTCEEIEGYKCDKCRQTSTCRKRTTIISYPRYWFVLMTRFTPDGRKIKTPVAFPPLCEGGGGEGGAVEGAGGEDTHAMGSSNSNSSRQRAVPYVCPRRRGACYVDLATPRPLLHPFIRRPLKSQGGADDDVMMGDRTASEGITASASSTMAEDGTGTGGMGTRFDSASSDASSLCRDALIFTNPMIRANRYEVIATVDHLGSTLNFGHYTSNVKRFSKSGGLESCGVAGLNDKKDEALSASHADNSYVSASARKKKGGDDEDAFFAGDWFHCDDDDIDGHDLTAASSSSSLLPTAKQGGDANVYLVLLKAVGNTYTNQHDNGDDGGEGGYDPLPLRKTLSGYQPPRYAAVSSSSPSSSSSSDADDDDADAKEGSGASKKAAKL